MNIKVTRVASSEEHAAMGDDAVARGLYRNDRTVFLPGMAWFMDWYFDPTGERVKVGKHVIYKEKPADPSKSHILSIHYWQDHADHRPPICVVTPSGHEWVIDAPASNGTVWTVTGPLESLTCSPSIVVPGYHGYLRNGEFTPDIEGQSQPRSPRL